MEEIGVAGGLIGVDLPEEYGGLGQQRRDGRPYHEEMAEGDFNVSYLQLLDP